MHDGLSVTRTGDSLAIDLGGEFVFTLARADAWTLYEVLEARLTGVPELPTTVPVTWRGFGRNEPGRVTYSPADDGCDLIAALAAHEDLGYRTARLTGTQRRELGWSLLMTLPTTGVTR